MGLAKFFSSVTDRTGSGRTGPTDSARDRLESSAETVDELTSRVREAARQRASDAAERAIDELLERSVGRPRDGLLDQSVLADEGDGFQSAGTDGVEAPRDRALEHFLRRYGLDEDRLDDRTLEAIRTRLSAVGPDVDAAKLLEQVLGERSVGPDGTPDAAGTAERDSSADARSGASATGESSSNADSIGADDPLADACSRLRARLDETADRPVDGLLEDVLERDAVAVGHDLERLLTEELPALAAETQARLASETAERGTGATAATDAKPRPPNARVTAATGDAAVRPSRWRSRRRASSRTETESIPQSRSWREMYTGPATAACRPSASSPSWPLC